MKSYPFTSQVTYDSLGMPQYDRAVDSEFLRAVFLQYFSDGVFYDQSDRMQVVVDTGMQVKVMPGCVHIRGAIGIEDKQRTLQVQAADTQDRIDTVVARLDLSLAARSIDLYIVKGTPAASPQAPALTRDSTIWELGLANLFVAKNVSTISQERITDTRLDTSRCGMVGAPVQPPFDTDEFFSQLEAAILAHQEDAEAQIEQLRKAIEAVEGDTAWMMKDLYDPQGLGKDVTIQTYTHSKSGTVHEFTGVGANGRAKMTADVATGDTFTVNGAPVTAYMGTDDAAGSMAGSAWNGRWVSFVFDGETLNFKGGGGLSAADKAKLIPGNIKAGVTFFEGTPRAVAGTFTADADAGAADLLSGRTAYVDGEKVTGSIPSKAAATYTPAAADQTIEAGQYLSGAQTVRGDANLKAENIKQGASIFGVAGALKLLYAGGCKTGTYAGGVRWNGASYVYEGHSYFYLTGQPKTLYVQYEATPYVKVDGKTYGPGQHDISSAKANCYVEYGDTGSRAGICILGV